MKGHFLNTVILDFRISQGNVATQLKWHGDVTDIERIGSGISQ